MLKADVLDFYGSIYSHSVPWAIDGKAASKVRVRARDPWVWSDHVDASLRNVQDGQTNGIDVGPDTSFVVSEMILSSVDKVLQDRFPQLRGFRYYDDFELYFPDRAEADTALVVLQDALMEFELVLNPNKTAVLPLPQPLDYGWALEMRRLARGLSEFNHQRDAIVEVFERAFTLIASGTREHYLRYAIGLMQENRVHSHNWPVYEKLLWQSTHIEPAVLPTVLRELLKYQAQNRGGLTPFPIDLPLAAEVLNRHAMGSFRRSYTHETVWAIWGLIALNQALESSVTSAMCSSTDPFVAMMMILASGKGLAGSGYSTAAWEEWASVEALKGTGWLVAYEAGRRGLALGATLAGVGWSADRLGILFEQLRIANVGFTADTFTFPQPETDSDEYDYDLNDDLLSDDDDGDGDGDNEDDDDSDF